jgi:hypothetical protein
LNGLEFKLADDTSDYDAILDRKSKKSPVLIKIQKQNEKLTDAKASLLKWKHIKGSKIVFLIQTDESDSAGESITGEGLILLKSPSLQIKRLLSLAQIDKTKKHEKRGQLKPIPDNLYSMLNREQLHTLKIIEKTGGSLGFVRRSPYNQKPVYVVFNIKGTQYAVLDEDGNLNRDTGIKIRTRMPDDLPPVSGQAF